MFPGALLLLLVAVLPAHANGSGDAAGHFAILSALCLFCFWRFFRLLRRARAIEDTPTAKIASAPQGRVELRGTVESVNGKNVLCPLTSTECVWYSYRVERYERQGKNSRWETIERGVSSQIFLLRDAGETVFVHPASAEVEARFTRQWKGSGPRPMPPFGPTGFFAGAFGGYRYTEEMIFPGDLVFVLGWFRTVSDGGGALSPDLNARLRVLKEKPEELLARFDRDKDGHISVEEWDAARAVVESELRAAAALAPPAQAVHTLAMPQDGDTPFLISTYPQLELAARYRRRMVLFLLAGLSAGAVAAGILPSLL